MKKIICFIESLGSGGAERQLCGLASMLSEHGYKTIVIYYFNTSFYRKALDETGVDCLMLPKLRNRFLRPIRIAKIINRERPDCVISFLTSVNLSVCLAKLFCRCNRLIVSERNTNQTTSFRDLITFNLYRWADAIVPNSFSQEKYIKERFPFLSDKTVAITNFVDGEKFKPAVKERINTIPVVLTLARYTEQKNCLNYIKAIKKVLDMGYHIHFDWYGKIDNKDAYFQKLKSLISELCIEDAITLHDQIEDNVSVYQQSDIFCLPSIYEGCPNTLVEAMSCGLPVLCGNVCDNPIIVKEDENGFLFDPSDIDSISAKIIKMLNLNFSARIMMGDKNRHKVLSQFTPNAFVEKYDALIKN